MLIGPAADKATIAAFRAKLKADAGGLHRPADAGALDLPDLRRCRHRAAPCRSAALRADRPQRDAHRARRTDPRRAEGRLARRQFEPGRRHQGYLGAGRHDGNFRCFPAPPTTSTGSPATSSAPSTSPACCETTQRLAALPAAYVGRRPTNGNRRSPPPAAPAPSFRNLRRGQRGATSPNSSPSRRAIRRRSGPASRPRAPMRARCARR